jgi:hypothetical protein
VISAGFWPGNGGYGSAAFYCYAAPEPVGLSDQKILPAIAGYDSNVKEFILKYDDVIQSSTPEDDVLNFVQSTYRAAATLGKWDTQSLEQAGPLK